MCSGAKHRNKAPDWVQSSWVNVRLEREPRKAWEREEAGQRDKRRLREREER